MILAVLMLMAAAGVTVLLRLAMRKTSQRRENTPRERILRQFTNHHLYHLVAVMLTVAQVACWIGALYYISGLYEPLDKLRSGVSENVVTVWRATFGVVHRPLFIVGEQQISLSFVVQLIVLVVISAVIAGLVRSLFRRQVLNRLDISLGVQESLATAVGYIVLGLALLIALEVAGLDLSTLAVIAGALSIGIGFGLQNIANNFVSGLILLLERPVQVGDRIEVGDSHGRVVRISARSTTVRTNDNVDIIVPNSELISGRVVNWSQDSRKIRFHIPVGVSYSTDIQLAMRLMVEAAEQTDGVISASARFVSFGGSSLDLEVLVWTRRHLHQRAALVSDVNTAVLEKFRENDIEIPFPQRDVHLISNNEQQS